MICCNSAFEQGNLDLWRYINAFIICYYYLFIRQVAQWSHCLYVVALPYSELRIRQVAQWSHCLCMLVGKPNKPVISVGHIHIWNKHFVYATYQTLIM